MAKKTSKKPAPKTSAPKKTAKKKPAAAKAKAGGGGGGGVKPVTTGKGATPAQIGADLVALFNAGKFDEPSNKYWAKDIESIEGVGMSFKGRKAVDAKNEEWMRTNKIHSASADALFVGATGFAVKFRMDVENTATGQRIPMEEVGVYTVMNGKIIREEFMYGQ
jgi:SnoaL-like domain